MAGIKTFIHKKMSKKIKFMGEEIDIYKLSVAEVLEIQEAAKGIKENEIEGFRVLKLVISKGAEGGDEMEESEFDTLPMEELSKLSTAIMIFSGIGDTQPGKS